MKVFPPAIYRHRDDIRFRHRFAYLGLQEQIEIAEAWGLIIHLVDPCKCKPGGGYTWTSILLDSEADTMAKFINMIERHQ